MIVGNDEKVSWDAAGKTVLLPPGKDTVLVIDIGTDPLAPRILANLPLMNSIFGPPTNLAITPDQSLALVANSMDWVKDGASWKSVPDNKLYVIDLTARPPKLIDTVTVGKQHSGMSINRAGNLALNANRTDHSVSVLRIAGKTVTLIDLEANPARVIDKVVIGDGPEGFAFSPTGKLAAALLLTGSNAAKTAWFYNRNATVVALKIDGKKVTRTNEVDVRGLPEGVVFSDDGRYIYVGNFMDSDISILRVDGDQIVNTGKPLALPGHPASMRGRTR